MPTRVTLGVNHVRIIRPGQHQLNLERELKVLFLNDYKVCQEYIDPVTVLSRSTGLRHDAKYKTVSFALGLMDAGFEVELQYQGKPPELFPRPLRFVYSYYLIGLAWANNALDQLLLLFPGFVRHEDRHLVWEATGKYYYSHPSRIRTEPLRLIIA